MLVTLAYSIAHVEVVTSYTTTTSLQSTVKQSTVNDGRPIKCASMTVNINDSVHQ